jgi:hypothetical protein
MTDTLKSPPQLILTMVGTLSHPPRLITPYKYPDLSPESAKSFAVVQNHPEGLPNFCAIAAIAMLRSGPVFGTCHHLQAPRTLALLCHLWDLDPPPIDLLPQLRLSSSATVDRRHWLPRCATPRWPSSLAPSTTETCCGTLEYPVVAEELHCRTLAP